VHADTTTTLERLRALFTNWVDDTNADVPWAFSVQIDGSRRAATGHAPDGEPDQPGRGAARGPRAVPQLRLGRRVFARSRSADEIFVALASVLGGVLASQDKTRCWLALRAFATADAAALADVHPATMSADRSLARHGIVELHTWVVAIEPSSSGASATIEVPPVLSGLDWSGAGLTPPAANGLSYLLAGLVGIDSSPEFGDKTGGSVATPGQQLARFGARHHAAGWFATVRRLVETDHAVIAPDRQGARNHIVAWLDPDH